MKKIIFLFTLAFTFLANAQQSTDSLKIEITSAGVIPLVVKADGVTAQQMYDRVKFQITKNFKNPEKVIKADEPGKLLRFSGYKSYSGGMASSGDYFYTCELEFKDGRYKISFYDVYRNTSFQTPQSCFNKEGKVRSMEAYKNLLNNYNDLVNQVFLVYHNSIVSKSDAEGW